MVRQKLVIVLLAGALLAGADTAVAGGKEDEVDVTKARPSMDHVFGKGVPMCEALLAALKRDLKAGRHLCVTPLSDDPSFSAIEWRKLDPARHLDIIKMDFAWDFAQGNWIWPENVEMFQKMRSGPDEYMKQVEEIWSKYRFNVEELIADGTIELEVARILFQDAEGPIDVYRTTKLYADYVKFQRVIRRWRAPRCDKSADGSGGHYWDFFYPWRSWQSRGWEEFIDLNNSFAMDLIVWNGRPYPVFLGVPVVDLDVIEQEDLGGAVYELGTVCQINVKWE